LTKFSTALRPPDLNLADGKSELARLFEIHRLVKGEGDAGPQPDHRRATTNQFTQ